MLNRGDFVGRWDPYYYKKDFFDLRKYLRSLPNVQKVGSLIASCSRGDGPREGFYTEDADNGVYFLRVNNLKNHTIDLKDIKLINRHVHEKTLKRTKVAPGDIVFAVSGTKDNLGTVSIVPEYIHEANLNSALLRLRLRDNTVSKEYFTYYFDFDVADRQIDMIGKGAAQNNLNSEEIFSMLIPVLSSENQQIVVDRLQAIKRSKEDKEAQAQALLNSIDEYLLGELGVTLPPEPDNTIENRMFKTSWRQVSGGRYDPDASKPYYQQLLSAIQSKPHKRLHEIARFSQETWNQGQHFVNTFPYLEISGIDISSGNVKDVTLTNVYEAPSRAKMIVRNGDLVISTTRPSRGAIAIFDQEELCVGSTGFAVIRKTFGVSKKYLHLILRSTLCLKQMEQRSSGGNYPAITQEELGRLMIPAPTKEIQERLVEEISAIRQQAQFLRQQAQRDFAGAKQEIERLILN